MISNIIEWKRILVANPQKNGLRFDCSCKLIMCNAYDHLLSISVNWSKVERINFTIFLKTLNWNFIIWKRLIVQGVYLHFTPFLGTGWVRFRKMLCDYSTRMITVIFSFFATLSWGWGLNIGRHHWKCQEVPRTNGSLAAHWHVVLLLVVSFF